MTTKRGAGAGDVFKRRWLAWWLVWAALHVAGFVMHLWLMRQDFPELAEGAWWGGQVSAYLWLLGGVFAYAQPRWVVWSLMHLGAGLAGAIVAASFYFLSPIAALVVVAFAILCRGLMVHRAYFTRPAWRWPAVFLLGIYDVIGLVDLCWRWGYPRASDAIIGAAVLALLFIIGLWLIRFILSAGHPILGVARTLIDEALRMRIAIVFIVVVLLVVPILPYLSDANELLRYRVGTFLAWSLWAITLALGFMTIFLACGTVSAELRDRQIYFTLTKPLARWQYLLGKWLGIVLLDALLLSVSVLGVYVYARTMERLAPDGSDERAAVQNLVLVARASVLPAPPGGVTIRDLQLEQIRRIAADRTSDTPLTEKELKDALNQALTRWHTIGRLGRQTYVFEGLQEAKLTSPELQLKLKANIADASKLIDDDLIWIQMEVNGRPYDDPGKLKLALRTTHVLPISTRLIDDQGNLSITLINIDPRGMDVSPDTDVSFDPEEGLELLYRYGSFGPNLARAAVILWLHLCFTAMLGLAAGALLSFPVACLLTITVYLTSLVSGFLIESFTDYVAVATTDPTMWQQVIKYPVAFWREISQGKVWPAAKVLIRLLGVIFVFLVPDFGKYDPIGLIASGQVILPSLVGRAVLMIGVIWSGIVALIGWAFFQRRELARVMV